MTLREPERAPSVLPARIGEYLVLNLLGDSGRMALVLLAERPRHGDQVVIKLAREETAQTPILLEQFEVEISAALKLVHPHIVRAYTRGVHQRRPYFVMEFIEGGTLADEKARERFRDADALLALMLKVADAVACAHRLKVVHNDLKSANILIDEQGEPFLTDFGIAGRDGQAPRVVGGTAGYGLPAAEKARRPEANDVACLGDIFSSLVAEVSASTSTARLSSAERRRQTLLLKNLTAVCQQAKRGDRYEDARALERDLDILDEGGSLLPVSWTTRCYDWALAHPVRASLLFLLSSFAIMAPLRLTGLAAQQREKSIAESEHALLAHARTLASMLDRDLIGRSGAVLARIASLPTLLTHSESDVEPEMVALARQFGVLDSVFVVDADCKAIDYWPRPFTSRWPEVSWRDYCQGALRGERIPYVGRSYYHQNKQGMRHLRLPISLPIYRDGQVKGVLVGTRDASEFQLINLGLPPDTRSAVVAAKDFRTRDDSLQREGQPPPTRENTWELIAESGLRNALAVLEAAGRGTVADARGHASCAEPHVVPNVSDAGSSAGNEQSKLMVALAPVGTTSLCVVQVAALSSATRRGEPLEDEAVLFGWLVVGATLVLVSLSVLATQRRKAAR